MLANIFTNENAWSVMWIAGIASGMLGFGFLLHTTYIARYWLKAAGKVVGNRAAYAQQDSGGSTVHFAEIEFQANDGKVYTVGSDVGHQTRWRHGEHVTVHYKPSNPSHAMTMKLWERLVFSGFFIGVSVLLWARIAGISVLSP